MKTYPIEIDTRPRTQFGLIALQADETIERDMRALLPEDVELLVSRVPSAPEVTRDTLAAMKPALTGAAALFPDAARFSVIGYGCTSGTAEIGAGTIAELITSKAETVTVTEPVSALLAALHGCNATRIGILSPYVEAVSTQLIDTLKAEGITTTSFASFNESNEARVARIAPNAIRSAAIDLAQGAEIDALFLSCTNLRTLDVLQDIEAAIGIPTLSSNQCLAWHMTALANEAGM